VNHPAGRADPLAVKAELLYLANLLLLPGIAFVWLLYLYVRRGAEATPLAVSHLEQTLSASLWAGLLLLAVNIVIVFSGGYGALHSWLLLIGYFTLCHAGLVLCGAYGLAKAMAGQYWRYPLVGPPLSPEGICRTSGDEG
jgi:hypothetical protein